MRNTLEIRPGFANLADVDIAYEDLGDINGEPMLLIMGLSGQLVIWPYGFCQKLVEKGYRVIRFDNRDIGLSSRVQINTPRVSRVRLLLRSQLLGWATPVPYTLRDMAADVIGLMNFLGIDRANIVGMSMGGMTAQIAAAELLLLH
jgi:pimeloyl-ACP methyl ester carboxylesterase